MSASALTPSLPPPLSVRDRVVLLLVSVLAVVSLASNFITIRNTQAATPFTAISSCIVTVTNVATSVASLIATAGCTTTNVGQFFVVSNPTANLVCLGDADVDLAVGAGDDCWPLCTGGAFCAEQNRSVPFKVSGSYLRAPAPQVVALLLGNSP